MRSVIGVMLSILSTGLILVGLWLSLPAVHESKLIDRPGIPVRLSGEIAQAVAYFEPVADELELVMIVSEAAADGGPLFKTRVRLSEGQSHTLAVGGETAQQVPEQFTFVRIGQTVRMSVVPAVRVVSAVVAEN